MLGLHNVVVRKGSAAVMSKGLAAVFWKVDDEQQYPTYIHITISITSAERSRPFHRVLYGNTAHPPRSLTATSLNR